MNFKKSILMMITFMFVVVGAVTHQTKSAQAYNKPYMLQVNKGTNVVTVFKADGTPYKAILCSTGEATPLGTYYTPSKQEWGELMGPSYGQFNTRIVNGILFHSVWYYIDHNKASQSTYEFNRLGTTASHGCVRLAVIDAKWIYDNCPLGTKVTIINGTSKDDPLGKPDGIKVSTATYMGWDPTDPDPSNPYLKNAPTITLEKSSYDIDYLDIIKLKDIASARAAYGTYLNSSLMIYIKVPNEKQSTKFSGNGYKFTKMGEYTITYKVKDPKNGKEASVDLKVKVNDTGKPLISKTPASKTISYKTIIDLSSNVTVLTPSGTNLKKNLVITITTPAKKKITFRGTKYTFNQLGVYTVLYTAKNPSTNSKSTKTVKFTVKDTKAPTFSGVTNVTKEYKTTFNVMSGVSAKATTGTSLTSRIKVVATNPSGAKATLNSNKLSLTQRGTYKVKYTVTGLNGKTATKTRLIKSVDSSVPSITGVPTSTVAVGWRQSVNLRSNIKAQTAKGTSLTSAIDVSVKLPSGAIVHIDGTANTSFTFNTVGAYYVTYKVKNPNNTKVITKSCKYYAKYTPVLTIPVSIAHDLATGTSDCNVRDNVKCVNKFGNATSGNLITFLVTNVSYTRSYISSKATKVNLKDNHFFANQPGVYTISYTAKGTNVVATNKKRIVKVIDSSDVVYISPKNLLQENVDVENIDLKNAVTIKTKAETDITSAVEVYKVYKLGEGNVRTEINITNSKIEAPEDGKYVLVYKIKNNAKTFFTGLANTNIEYEFSISSTPKQEEEKVDENNEVNNEVNEK